MKKTIAKGSTIFCILALLLLSVFSVSAEPLLISPAPQEATVVLRVADKDLDISKLPKAPYADGIIEIAPNMAYLD